MLAEPIRELVDQQELRITFLGLSTLNDDVDMDYINVCIYFREAGVLGKAAEDVAPVALWQGGGVAALCPPRGQSPSLS